jgi:hypothetical protein
MLQVLAGIADPIEQDHFINEVAGLLATRADTIRRLLRRDAQPRVATAPAEPRRDPDRELDVHLLALLRRLRDSGGPLPERVEFLLPESRAMLRSLGGPLPPELEPHWQLVERKRSDVERLSPRDFDRALERTQLEIRKRLLVREQEEIRALARDGDVYGWASKLDGLAHAIHAIDQQLVPEREGAGSR